MQNRRPMHARTQPVKVGFTNPIATVPHREVSLPAAGVVTGAAIGLYTSSLAGGIACTIGGIGLSFYSFAKEPWHLFQESKVDDQPIGDVASFVLPAGLSWLAAAGLRRIFT